MFPPHIPLSFPSRDDSKSITTTKKKRTRRGVSQTTGICDAEERERRAESSICGIRRRCKKRAVSINRAMCSRRLADKQCAATRQRQHGTRPSISAAAIFFSPPLHSFLLAFYSSVRRTDHSFPLSRLARTARRTGNVLSPPQPTSSQQTALATARSRSTIKSI